MIRKCQVRFLGGEKMATSTPYPTSSPSSTVSAQDSTDCESTSLRCKKIQIYPSPELNRIWKHWNAACRYVYNRAIDHQKVNGGISKLKLRNAVMQSDLPQWVKDAPCHIRQNAIFDAHRAITSQVLTANFVVAAHRARQSNSTIATIATVRGIPI
jgi:hypothetical protein